MTEDEWDAQWRCLVCGRSDFPILDFTVAHEKREHGYDRRAGNHSATNTPTDPAE